MGDYSIIFNACTWNRIGKRVCRRQAGGIGKRVCRREAGVASDDDRTGSSMLCLDHRTGAFSICTAPQPCGLPEPRAENLQKKRYSRALSTALTVGRPSVVLASFNVLPPDKSNQPLSLQRRRQTNKNVHHRIRLEFPHQKPVAQGCIHRSHCAISTNIEAVRTATHAVPLLPALLSRAAQSLVGVAKLRSPHVLLPSPAMSGILDA